jgi:hypothetical protein
VEYGLKRYGKTPTSSIIYLFGNVTWAVRSPALNTWNFLFFMIVWINCQVPVPFKKYVNPLRIIPSLRII